jgi:PAS domain S-box-containing protein
MRTLWRTPWSRAYAQGVRFVPSSSPPRDDTSHDAVSRAHLWFLESMDRVHRAIQGTTDVVEMMSDVLDAVVAIFDCDRALLAYPCDPDATTFQIPMRRTRPEYASPLDAGASYPVDDDVVAVYRATRASGAPVPLGPGGQPVPLRVRRDFGVQSALVMAIYPKGDRPYHFVLHQCSRPRVWRPEEQRLFQEIGRRLADALTTMLLVRGLRRSEARLEEAQRITHAAYTDRDLATGVISTSEEGLRILGLPPGQQVVHLNDVLARVHPHDRDRVERLVHGQPGDAPYDVEYRILGPNGDVRVVHSRGEVLRDDDGQPYRAVGIVQDVTDYRRVEYLVRQVFESSPDGLAIVGRDFRYRRVNQIYRDYWQSTPGPLVGRHLAEVLGRDLFESTGRPNLERCFAGERVQDTRWIRTRNGDAYTAVSYTPLRPSSDDVVEAALVLLTDLTPHLRAQEALQQAQADLARIARATTLAEIGSSLAHELYQPLTSVVMGAIACRRWLDADPPDLGEARAAVERVVKDGNRASQVIARIRGLLRRGEPVAEALDVDELIADTLTLVRGELTRRDVATTTDLHASGVSISGDRVQLQQVIVNLILNAADAMAALPSGERRLTLRSDVTQDGGVHVAVEDTGVGLDPAHADQLFKPFFTTKTNGLGVGLSISRSIIDSHGGRLWATPNAGPGVTFHFTLPPPPPS